MKLMGKKINWGLVIIFALTLSIRLFLAFTIPNLTHESYFNMRQVNHITENGIPLYNDNLSYGGRENIFLPFFHYFMSFFDLFLPLDIVAKIIPNILIATLTITAYLISKKITNNNTGSLFASLITGFLPILYFTNSFIVDTLFLPLAFLAIYSFLMLKKKNYVYLYIFTFFLLSITSAATFLLIMGFGIYLLLSIIENKKLNKSEVEIILFSLLFYIWVQFIFFKNTLISEGINFIWQNIPTSIITQYFPQPTLFESIVLVSVIPFLIGVYIVYRSLFKLKKEKSFLLISFAVSTVILALLKLISFKQSLAFFGLILAILFSTFYSELSSYLDKTKFSDLKKFKLIKATLVISITFIILLTTAIPAIAYSLEQQTPTNEEIAAFKWVNEYTPKRSGVSSLLEEGHLVTYYSDRHNFMDDQFNLIEDTEKEFNELNDLYTSNFQTRALNILQDKNINYIVLTPRVTKQYGFQEPPYLKNNDCFEKVYEIDTKIYAVKCKLKSTKVSE